MTQKADFVSVFIGSSGEDSNKWL